jgi:hypothetical protein
VLSAGGTDLMSTGLGDFEGPEEYRFICKILNVFGGHGHCQTILTASEYALNVQTVSSMGVYQVISSDVSLMLFDSPSRHDASNFHEISVYFDFTAKR